MECCVSGFPKSWERRSWPSGCLTGWSLKRVALGVWNRYARQFLFAPASECYKFAYEIGQQSESSEAYLLALSCREKQVSGRKSSIDEQLKQLREVKRSGKRVDYEQQMEQLLLQLRTEYRKSE